MSHNRKDHDTSVKWEPITPAKIDPTTFGISFRTANGVPFLIRATGPCPRCKHPIISTESLYELDMFTGGDLSVDLIKDLQVEVERRVASGAITRRSSYRCQVHCSCGLPHKGRPINEREGCGASFALVVDAPAIP